MTKRHLNRIIRFKNLIIHREQWGPEIESAPTLDELFPGENLQRGTMDAVRRIEQEIREMKLIISYNLRHCGVGTRMTVTTGGETNEYDLLVDYFRMANDNELDRRQRFEEVMELLDAGIGAHKNRLPRAKIEMFSPITWIAYMIRLPITVLERAGLASHPKSQEKFLNAYAWVVQFAMLALILVVAGHYGAKIPWSDIFSYVIKAISGMK